MRTNYVLIDYENVQPDAVSLLDADHFKVKVFVGASQNRLAFDTASALQKLGDKAEYVKISGNGSNALDLHIAYHIGRISAQDPTAYFHIVSKDTGFDPLVQHLRNQNISAARFNAVSEIPRLQAVSSKTIPDKLAVVVMNLQQRGASKPRTLKTLKNTINALFQKLLSEAELVAIVNGLEQEGFITIDATKVTYILSTDSD